VAQERRLVGIDLGITSEHTVCVLRGDGTGVCRRRCRPTRESLEEIERAALAGADEGVRLEVVMEPTGPAWLPVAVFFQSRGHLVHRVSSAKASDLRRFLSRHAKSNSIDAETLARLPLIDLKSLLPLMLPDQERAALYRQVRTCGRLTRQITASKLRLKALVRELLPVSPLSEELGKADLALLERTGAEPQHLIKMGKSGLGKFIAKVSRGQLGVERAEVWLESARLSLELYGQHPAAAYAERAAEVQTEVRLLAAIGVELAEYQNRREKTYRQVDPGGLARSLPGFAEVGAPVLVAYMGPPQRFARGPRFRSYTGLATKASQTGDSDRKGQPMSKAGPSQLRTTLFLAADTARQQDPQLARIYYVQMVERGANHTKALCVVAAHLAERALAVMKRGTPYQLRDIDGRPVSEIEAKAIIASRFMVPEEVRQQRRSRKQRRKAPQPVLSGQVKADAHGPTARRPSLDPMLTPPLTSIKDVLGRAMERTNVPT
jgi:transposase